MLKFLKKIFKNKRYYCNADDIPLYNWIQLSKSQDYKYLIRTKNYDSNNLIISNTLGEQILRKIIYSIRELDLSISSTFAKLNENYFNYYVTENEVYRKTFFHVLFNKYFVLLDLNFTNFSFYEFTEKSVFELYKKLKVKFSSDLFDYILQIFDYKKLSCINKTNIDYDIEIINIEKILKIKINTKKTSLNKYLSYKYLANELITKEKKDGRN